MASYALIDRQNASDKTMCHVWPAYTKKSIVLE